MDIFDYENLAFFKSKKCILLGELEECERFYCSFHDFINIEHIVMENESCTRLESHKDLYIQYSNIESELGKHYIILCYRTNIGDSKWEDIFYQKGLYYKYDYIDSTYILMLLRKNREILLKEGEEKEIWVFGAGDNGERFWKNYHKEYNICGFISNYENEEMKCGLPILRLSEIKKKKNTFIVICSIYEINMYLQMIQMGMTAEQDFTFSVFFPKKLFVGLGMCQILYCINMLLHNKNFTSKYICMRFGEDMKNRTSVSNRIRLKEYAEFCDVLFYQGVEFNTKMSVDYTIIFNEYKHAYKIQMPFYFFRGIHLQSNVFFQSDIHSTTISPESAFSDIGLYCYTMDKEILKLLDGGMHEKQILSKILSDDYFSKEEVIHQFDSAVKSIKFLDKFSDIKIGTFLADNYKDMPVFTDTEHFGPELQVYIANELAKKMGIDGLDEAEKNRQIEYFKSVWIYNVYVYPSVSKVLGLNYCNNMKYKNTPYAIDQEISIEDYILKQINYVKRARILWKWLET